jgi:hypothetical protein
MQSPENVNFDSEYRYELNVPVNCELFGDRVARRICTLVKKELDANGKRSESCSACRYKAVNDFSRWRALLE